MLGKLTFMQDEVSTTHRAKFTVVLNFDKPLLLYPTISVYCYCCFDAVTPINLDFGSDNLTTVHILESIPTPKLGGFVSND